MKDSIVIILIFLNNFYCPLNGIQVFENDRNDTTTSASVVFMLPTAKPIEVTESLENTEESMSATVKSEIENSTMEMEKLMKMLPVKNVGFIKNQSIESLKTSKKSLPPDQQQKSSAQQVHHKTFIPSPELSTNIHSLKTLNKHPQDNFYPTNQYYKPLSMYTSAIVNHQPSHPVDINSSKWTLSTDVNSLRQSYPKFEEQIREKYIHQTPKTTTTRPTTTTTTESSKIIWNPSEKGHWVWMPHEESLEKPPTDKPTSSHSNSNWKWSFVEQSDKDKETKFTMPTNPISFDTIKDYQQQFIRIPDKDQPYSFDTVTTHSTPFIYETSSFEEERHKKENFFQHNLDLLRPTSTHVPEWNQLTASKGRENVKENTHVSPWKKIIHVLSAAIPIGILISALTPQVIFVNPNSTTSTQGSTNMLNMMAAKHRSVDANDLDENQATNRKLSNPLMDFLNILGNHDNTLDKYSSCDDRHFCEVSVGGINRNANVLQKMLWKIAIETPKDRAIKSGLYEIFQAIKTNNCSIFPCGSSILLEKYRKNFGRNLFQQSN